MSFHSTGRCRVSTVAREARRRGGFTVVAAFCLLAAIAFAALSVDIGMIALTRTRLQNAADAAALAAAQEIPAAVQAAGAAGKSANEANRIAEDAGRAMAVKVAGLNGVYIDGDRDVKFGKRVYNKSTGRFAVQWGSSPYNAVKVTAHMDNSNPKAPDASLDLLFAPVFGQSAQKVVASGAAYVEARDLILCLDYTASMNDDSTFAGIPKLGRTAVESNMVQIFNQLGLNLPKLPDTPQYLSVTGKVTGGPNVTVTFKGPAVSASSASNITSVKLTFQNGGTQTFTFNAKTVTATGTSGNAKSYVTRADVASGGKTVSLYNSASEIKKAFGLDTVAYPYPAGSWDEYIDRSQDAGLYKLNYGYDVMGGYDWKYGKLTFVFYLLNMHSKYTDTPVLWKTSHYPFHAMKEGASLFCDYMGDLDFGDHVGLVSYDESARTETKLVEPLDGTSVDISSSPITGDYAAIDKIQRHKQAGHYASMTGIGYGVEEAIKLLQKHGRYGARPTILLMTDGNANKSPSGWSKPGGWDWAALTDYDGNGSADYSTADVDKLYAFYQAKRAIDLGYTIHTMTVGADADRDLMKAIAFAGKGEYIDVPGGGTIASQEVGLKDAFRRIATTVPPAKLLIERD
jgi:Flp pilus assembly protein TadG